MSTVQPIASRFRDDSRSRGQQENSVRVFLARVSILSVCILAVSATPARGQSPTLTSVPPFVRVTGSFHPADGQPPAPVETMTLSVYGEATGGVPLWQETQKVAVNPDGRFTLLLGLTRPEGLPPESVRLRRAAVARDPRRASGRRRAGARAAARARQSRI